MLYPHRPAGRFTLAAERLSRVLGSWPITASVVGGALSAVGLGIYSHWVEPSWLEVTRTEIPLPGLAPGLDGLTIAQISDPHLPPRPGQRNPSLQAIQAVNAARPDLVVLTGDYLDRRSSLSAFRGVLESLRVRPAYAIFGNHDYRFGPATRRALEQLFAEYDVALLDNRSIAYARGRDRVWFVGVGDAYTSHDRLGEALAGLSPTDTPRVLLTHYPDFVKDIAPEGFGLALAGHTHGAQIQVPVLAEWALKRSDTTFDDGRYRVGGTTMYVSRGLGTSRYPFRFRARPELPFIVLRSTPEPPARAGRGFDAARSPTP